MNILISSLFFYKHDLSVEFLDHLPAGLEGFQEKYPNAKLKLVITNNAPNTGISNQLLSAIDTLEKKAAGLNVEWVDNPWNKGFGLAHNEVLRSRDCDVFVVLNNDLFFSDPDWLMKLVEPIEKKAAQLVGLKNAPRLLKPDGNGMYASDDSTSVSDYVEGSAFAVETSCLKGLPLFAEDIRVAYCEDSDFSLRFRQAGFKSEFVEIAHEHRRSSSTGIIPKPLSEAIHERNRSRLLSRWGHYLQTRTLQNRIFLELVSDGWGDVFCALPAVLQIQKDHPSAHVCVRIKQPFIAYIFDAIPNVHVEIGSTLSPEEFKQRESENDRLFRLENIAFTEAQLLGREIASSVGVEFNPQAAEEHLKRLVLKNKQPLGSKIEAKSPLAIIHADYSRPDWEGRGPAPALFHETVAELRSRNYHVVAIGSETSNEELVSLANLCTENRLGATSFPEMLELIGRADLFVGIDSGPIHIAQHLGTKTFAVFGATLPTARLFRWEKTDVYMNWSLDCLGCYHRLFKANAYNYCIRRDEACIKKLESTQLRDALVTFLDQGPQNLPKALERFQETLAVKREFLLRTGQVRPSLDVELERLRAEVNSSGYRTFRLVLSILKKATVLKPILRPFWRALKTSKRIFKSKGAVVAR